MRRFITVTPNPALDRNYTVPYLTPGQVHRAGRVATTPGGKGINVARVLQTLGAGVIATGLTGGANGDRLKEGLTNEGIQHEFLDVSPSETRLAIVLIDPESGNQTVINEAGPQVSDGALDGLKAMLTRLTRSGDMVAFSGSLPPGIAPSSYHDLIVAAKSCGAQTLLDSSGPPLQDGARAHPTIVKVNRNEAREIGVFIDSWRRDAGKAAIWLAAQGVADFVAITGGADGAVIAGPGGAYSASAPAFEIVSAVGSGDAFAAGLAFGLAIDSGDTGAALRLAAACGGANALNEGAGCCTREQIETVSGKIEVARVG